MIPIDILRAARTLISDPACFTTTPPATTEAGWIASPISPNAVRWSAFGALVKVNGGAPNAEADQALRDAVAEILPRDALACRLGHAASLAALDRAAVKLSSPPFVRSRSVLARAEERRRANPPLFEGSAVWSKISPEFQAEIGSLVLNYAAAFNAVDGTSLSEARLRVAEDDLFGTILEAVPVEAWRGDDGRVRVPSSFGARF